VKAGQWPTPLLLHEDQRRTKPTLKVVVLVLPLCRFAARDYRRIFVDAHLHLVSLKGLILQVPGFVPRQPLVLGQYEATRPYADKVVRQSAFEEGGIVTELGGGPILYEFLQLSGSSVHDSPPLVDLLYRFYIRECMEEPERWVVKIVVSST